MMKFPTAVFVLCVAASAAFAEAITGPADVLDKPYGRVLFTLNDGVKVNCAEMDNHYQRIAFVGVVKDDALWGRDRIKKHEPIYGLNGDRLGESIRQVDLPLGKIARGEGQYAAAFTGYVAWTSIDRTTEVEHHLEPLVDRKLHPLTLDDIQSHLAAFGLKKGVSQSGFDTYAVYDSRIDDASDPAPRLILVFRANQFVAVLAKRDIHFIAHSPVFVRDGYTLTYVEPVEKKAAAQLEKRVVSAVLAGASRSL